MNNWMVIITFTFPHEAYLAKGMLDAAGLEIVIRDEMTVQVHNFYSNAIGGVKLLVKSEEAEAAHQLLKEAGYIVENTPEKRLEVFSAEHACTCPYCQSDEVVLKKIPVYSVVLFALLLLDFPWLFLLVGLPVPFLPKKTYYCFDCEKEWMVKK